MKLVQSPEPRDFVDPVAYGKAPGYNGEKISYVEDAGDWHGNEEEHRA